MQFLFIILLVLILMVGIPLFRGWLYMQRLKRRVNDAFGRSSGDQRQGRQRHSRYEDDDDGKIFESTDGEYAEYEEISGTITEEETSEGYSRTVIEEQVTDAEFEEIRD